MILMDANVFMFAAGSPHRNKEPSVALLDRVASGRLEASMDAEVLQEILHRYRSIGRWEDGRRVYDMARRIVPGVITVTVGHLDAARRLMDELPRLTARDALHASVCLSVHADAFCSYDTDFDVVPGIRRATPDALVAEDTDR